MNTEHSNNNHCLEKEIHKKAQIQIQQLKYFIVVKKTLLTQKQEYMYRMVKQKYRTYTIGYSSVYIRHHCCP